MQRSNTLGHLVLAGALVVLACPIGAQSLDVGGEVVFSGGPTQPPRSVQTGNSIHISNVRSSGPLAGPAIGTDGPSGGNQGMLGMAAEEPPKPAPPLVAYDLAGATVPKLGELIRGSNRAVDRFSAVRALGKAQGEGRAAAVPHLLEALGDEDLRVTAEAVRSLAMLRDRRALKPLVELLNQSDPELLDAVIRALGCLGDAQSRGPIEGFADGSGGKLDLAARAALAQLGSK